MGVDEDIGSAAAEDTGSAAADDIAADDIALRAGRALRAARLASGLTLAALADKCGLSQPFLSQVERGKALPSLLTLHRIAKALGVSVQAVLASEDPDTIAVVRAGEGRRFDRGEPVGAVLERFLVEGRRQMEPAEVTADPGASSGEYLEHEGEELLYVLEGALEVDFGRLRTEHLGPGDALYFPATVPHKWYVTGETPAKFLVIATPPSF